MHMPYGTSRANRNVKPWWCVYIEQDIILVKSVTRRPKKLLFDQKEHEERALTSFPLGFLITTPSTIGDLRASACAYSGPTVYTYIYRQYVTTQLEHT
jgi:hypothetical protein